MKLYVEHNTIFQYDAPVYETATELRLQPVDGSGDRQRCERFTVQVDPPAPMVDALAQSFRAHNLDLKQLMRTIFRSSEFYAPEIMRSQIKSPVQFLVQALRTLAFVGYWRDERTWPLIGYSGPMLPKRAG